MLVYEKSGPKGQIEWHRGYEIRLKDQILNRYLILGIFLYLKDLPTAALCENMIENVLLFLNGFSCLVMGIIVRKGLFVKKNNKKSLETCKLCQPERKMVISKKNITFQKLP